LVAGGRLHSAVERPRREIGIDHAEVIVGALGRDVAHLAKVPDHEHAGPGPLAPCHLDSAHGVLGLLLLVHPLPDEQTGIHVGGGGVPAELVEPHSLVSIAVLFHDLPLQHYPLEVEHVDVGGILRGAIHTKGVRRVDVKVVLRPGAVHRLEVVEVAHRAPYPGLGMGLPEGDRQRRGEHPHVGVGFLGATVGDL